MKGDVIEPKDPVAYPTWPKTRPVGARRPIYREVVEPKNEAK